METYIGFNVYVLVMEKATDNAHESKQKGEIIQIASNLAFTDSKAHILSVVAYFKPNSLDYIWLNTIPRLQ